MEWFEQLAISRNLKVDLGTYQGTIGKAIFNGTNRYFLEKRWADGGAAMTALMMNPSSASHSTSDSTVSQLMEVAKRKGCNALYVVNVSSFVCGRSRDVNQARFGFNAVNSLFISGALNASTIVFLGWGIKGQLGMGEQISTNKIMKNVFLKAQKKFHCYDLLEAKNSGLKAAGHPFYLPHPRPRGAWNRYVNASIKPIPASKIKLLLLRM